jgi:PBP1b-binding outer membrane lipoprotein LpoB
MKKTIMVIGVLAAVLLLAGCVQTGEKKTDTTAGTAAAIDTTEVDSGLTEVDALINETDAGIEDLTIDETTFQ